MNLKTLLACVCLFIASMLERQSLIAQTAVNLGEMIDYRPDSAALGQTPMRYVRINIHVVRKSNKTGNFSDSSGKAYIKKLVSEANYNLQNNQKMNLPIGNQTPVLPIGYQYVLTGENPNDDGIYFIDDHEVYLFDGSNIPQIATSTLFDRYGKQKGKVINIFLMENKDSTDYNGRGIGYPDWVKMSSSYANFKRDFGTWFMVGLFNHEVGHSLGLWHTWDGGSGCPDTPTHPNCWNHEPEGICKVASNNMMDYNANDNALTPCQIAIVQYNFTQSQPYGSRSKLIENWCIYKPDSLTTIAENQNTVWKKTYDLEGDITIAQNASLTIKSRVNLPKNAKIYIAKNAKLIVDGGLITNLCQEQWAGIEVWGASNASKKRNYAASVILKNNGLIENLKTTANR